jgi:hypothetical protein
MKKFHAKVAKTIRKVRKDFLRPLREAFIWISANTGKNSTRDQKKATCLKSKI